nr:TIGR03087 family PEP-CTERM/XrtA system glycosyltransferase [Sphingomonas japonica]
MLFLAHRIPYPPDRGDKIRAFHLLKHLARTHRVHLVAFADDPRDLGHRGALAEWTASCTIVPRTKPKWRAGVEALASGKPISLTAFDDPAMHRAVAAVMARPALDDIVVFSGQMAQYLPRDSGCRIVMDFCDMDSAKFASYAASGSAPMRWLMAREARRLQAFESDVAARVDASLFVSAAEAALFAEATGHTATVVENGIDTERFDPAAAFAQVDLGSAAIVFTGQMDYPPNVDAVTWFADAVWPAVHARHPGSRFVIVGRAPTEAVRRLADRPGITVTGEVDDVRGWLAAAAVAVAPLRVARGVQNKVLEAMAMARPVLVSAVAAEGIDHGGTLRVADDPAALAAAIDTLLGDADAAAALGRAARERVRDRYGWDARLAVLDAIVDPSRRAAA